MSRFDPDLEGELRALVKRRLQDDPNLRVHAAVEARWIVQHAMDNSRNGEDARTSVHAMATQRLAGVPLSRIFGEAEFYGLPIGVNDATLDPRNDTEALVDLVLAHLEDQPLRLLDLGTGTGCIPIALLSCRHQWRATGVDLAPEAVRQAEQNRDDPRLASHQLNARLGFLVSDWFDALDVDVAYDLIVSNPPYLTSQEMVDLDASVRGYDPSLALDGGPDGLAPYRLIFSQAAAWLHQTGMVAVEIGWQQKDDVVSIAKKSGFRLLDARQDLGQRDRALLFQRVN